MESSHVLVINWIDDRAIGKRFAIWEIAVNTKLSAKTISRVLAILRSIGFVGKMPRAYKHKYWESTKKWTNAKDIIEKFEFWCILQQDEVKT